jgi:hypothetical protein
MKQPHGCLGRDHTSIEVLSQNFIGGTEDSHVPNAGLDRYRYANPHQSSTLQQVFPSVYVICPPPPHIAALPVVICF